MISFSSSSFLAISSDSSEIKLFSISSSRTGVFDASACGESACVCVPERVKEKERANQLLIGLLCLPEVLAGACEVGAEGGLEVKGGFLHLVQFQAKFASQLLLRELGIADVL